MDNPQNEDAPSPKKGASQPPDQQKPATTWAIPIITAATILGAFCLYYFVYVTARREYLANRNFRALAALGDQLQTIVSIHGSVLEYYADQRDPHRTTSEDSDKKPLKEFLLVRPEDQNLEPKEQEQEALRDYLQFYAPGFDLPETPGKPANRASRLEVLRRNGMWYMVFTATQHKAGEAEFTASRPLAEVIGPLVTSLPFDDILLVSPRGAIVYQKEKAGPQFTQLGDLLQTAAPGSRDKPSAGQSPETEKPDKQTAAGDAGSILRNADPIWRSNPVHVAEIAITGTRYKVFIQPVLLNAFIADPADHERPQEFVLCGLRSSQSLEWEALSISYTAIIWATALFFVVAMSGPMFKVVFMNHRERLHLREFAFLGVFLVLLTGVFTFCGLQAFQVPANDHTEEWLRDLGSTLSANIVVELGYMRDQLVNYCRSQELKDDFQRVPKEHEIIRNVPGAGKSLDAVKATPPAGQFNPQRTVAIPGKARGYPYLENAFWADDDGHQIVKWSAGPYVTPMIDVSALPSYTGPRTTYLKGEGPPFYFAPVLPPNKLDYLATMAMNTCDCNPDFCYSKKGEQPIRGDIAGGAAALVSKPLSLIDPILPFGYGFALVDQTGLVLFHADKIRNNSENFRQETDWSNELYASMFGQANERSVSLNYKGRAYRARVFPIPSAPEAPRSLIVYSDLTSVRTRDLEAVTMAATLYLLSLAGPMLILAIWWLARRPRFVPDWMWPDQHSLGAYRYQIAAYILLVLLFWLVMFGGSAEQVVVACFAIPNVALLIAWLYFRLRPARAEAGACAAEPGRSPAALATLAALGATVFAYALVLVWRHPPGLVLMLGFGVIAAAPLLKKPRFHLLRFLEAWFSERFSSLDTELPWPLLNYRTAFVAATLLLLLLIGVLTPMGLFQVTLALEQRLGIKEAQLHLASNLGERRRALLDECKARIIKSAGENDGNHGSNDDVTTVACADFQNVQGNAWRYIVPYLPDGLPRVEKHEAPKCREFYSGWLQSVIYLLHHDYNSVSAETRGIIADNCSPEAAGGASRDWSWEENESTIQLRWHGVPPAENRPPEDLLVSSAVPHSADGGLGTGAGVTAGVMLLMGGLFWGLARRVFLFNVAPLRMTGAREAAEALREGRSILVLTAPRFADWQVAGPKWQLNIREAAAAGPKWAETLDLNAVPQGVLVEIRNFEYLEQDAETENQKFILLDRLFKRDGTQIAAIMIASPSSMDYRRRFPSLEVVDLREEPYHWLQQYTCPARDLIWKECRPLAALWPIGAQLAEDLRRDSQPDETIEPDTVASEILERADVYYRMIWKECSMDEKFVLAQLAEDGVLNPTNRRAIRQLMRRGLIVEDPQFRPMNESFRRFVRSAATPDLKARWLAESRLSGWGKTHGVFFTTMVAVGVFLLATQNALWQSSAAYVTTALGALGTLTKLFNTFRGGGAAASSDKAG